MTELQPSFIAFDAAAPFGYLLAQYLEIPAVQLGKGIRYIRTTVIVWAPKREDMKLLKQQPCGASLGGLSGAPCRRCPCPWQIVKWKAVGTLAAHSAVNCLTKTESRDLMTAETDVRSTLRAGKAAS